MTRVTVIAALFAALVPTAAVAKGPIVLPPSLGKPVLKGAQNFTERTVDERVRPPQTTSPQNEERSEAPPKQPKPKTPRSK